MARLFVGNISYRMTEDELRDTFGEFGDVTDTHIVTDRETGRSKGFAFITFAEASGAEAALKLDGTDLGGRQIRVNLAKEDRGGGRRGGGGFRQ